MSHSDVNFDHNPKILTIGSQLIDNFQLTLYNCKEVNKSRKRYDIDRGILKFTTAIQKCIRNNIPPANTLSKDLLILTDDIKTLINYRNRCRRSWQKLEKPQDKLIMCLLRENKL